MLVKEIVAATNGRLLSGCLDDDILGFTQDTRLIKDGDFYIPLKGEKSDGHDYIEQAFLNGAVGIISDREVSYPDKIVIVVEDTLKALGDMARYLREHRDIKVIGITGSVGKTSTKDMVYAVVSMKYRTLKTLGNYNNHIGLPLTILRYCDEEAMILEMGMNHLGEISYLTHIALPDVALITNVGTAHIGELGSRDNILRAKMEITEGLKDEGLLIINNDNDMLHGVDYPHMLRIGLHDGSDLMAYNVDLRIEDSYFDIDYKEKTYHVHVPVSGEHFVYNALLALAVGLSLDIDINDCIRGIEGFELTKNRMDIICLKDDIKVIDGTYNANLDSMKSSLDVLAQYPTRKIAVLADMLELGDYEKQMHELVGQHVVDKGIDELLCVGKASANIVLKAHSMGMDHVYHFETNRDVMEYLDELLEKDDVVLVKGSNGMRLKEVVEFLKEKRS